MIRIGPGGWSNDDWIGIGYPKPKPRDFAPLHFYYDLYTARRVDQLPLAPYASLTLG